MCFRFLVMQGFPLNKVYLFWNCSCVHQSTSLCMYTEKKSTALVYTPELWMLNGSCRKRQKRQSPSISSAAAPQRKYRFPLRKARILPASPNFVCDGRMETSDAFHMLRDAGETKNKYMHIYPPPPWYLLEVKRHLWHSTSNSTNSDWDKNCKPGQQVSEKTKRKAQVVLFACSSTSC